MADQEPDASTSAQSEVDPAEAQAPDAAAPAVQPPAEGSDDAQAESPEGRNVDLPNFQQVLADVEASGLDLLHDVELNVKIELGRTEMYVEDVLRLAEGSVVELDKLAGDPVDIYVNERLVARGEVLVLNDNFCVRVSEIVGETDVESEGPVEGVESADAPAEATSPEPAAAGSTE